VQWPDLADSALLWFAREHAPRRWTGANRSGGRFALLFGATASLMGHPDGQPGQLVPDAGGSFGTGMPAQPCVICPVLK
jgi:hypothetical protein